ncbi:MAG: polysaccharide pyruvyl transferase family protein, partial [Methanobacterium sp.]|nr:polysaccharide pyruvyl transferase family protein [Methanobacterium sp.]
MIKMLLLNVGEYNKGNVALVKSTIYIIEKFIQDNVQFVLLGPWEGNFYGQPIKNGYLIPRKANQAKTTRLIITLKNSLISIWYIFYCIFLRISNELNLSFYPTKKSGMFFYYNCDLVINSGGDHLSGEYGKETISSFLELLYSFILKKPIILFSESLGKFENSYLNFFAKIIFNRVDLILVREQLSYDYLIENKINNPQICLTADAAFSLIESDALKIEQILLNEGVYELKTPIIGLNPSKLITKFFKNFPNKEEKIINIFINTIDELNKKDFNILLIPHVYTSTDDDRIIINEISKKI